jgi:DNA-binding transcriptional MerR regulator
MLSKQESVMATYSISQLAALAGVSVRTLHHYDAIGLLQSAGRSNGGYRLYNQHQVLQLQQILMFRELEYPLAQIQQIMQQPDYDLTLCLRQQQQLLAKRINHLQRLHSMLDRTIQQQESGQMTTSAELFNQFSQATLREEAVQRWGETAIRQSEQQVAQLSTAQQQQLTVEGEQIAMGLAQCLHLPADAAEVQLWAVRQHQWLQNYGPCSLQRLVMLADLYVSDARFLAYYERFGAGTAVLLRDALHWYVESQPS